MLGLFRRAPPAPDMAGLGASLVALPLPDGCTVAAGCCGVIVDAGGRTRRAHEGTRLKLDDGESALCFHPGPYAVELVPFAAAPEVGLAVRFAIDSPDPRLSQQRFDLYLASECMGAPLGLASFAQQMEQALQRELAQGNIELPPCATLDEWNAFRAGFNQLLYTRFGVVVDDCLPLDLGESRDYSQMLRARAEGGAVARDDPRCATPAAQPFDAAAVDAQVLRRLFLELPCVMSGVRLAALPGSPALFRRQQELLQRLDSACLSASTMPALELAAPGQPLAAIEQVRRARHSQQAGTALDEAWALLARIEPAGQADMPALLDELDRIVSNLETHCARRRAVHAGDIE
jgi:hypothetical protein